MRSFVRAGGRHVACVAVVAALTMGGAGAAYADDPHSAALVSDQAVDMASGEPIALALDETPHIAASGTVAGTSVSLPEDPSAGIILSAQGSEPVTISLPSLAAEDAAEVSGSVVSYAGEEASTVPLMMVDGTLQIMSVLTTPAVDPRFGYVIEPKSGGHLVSTVDGGFDIINTSGAVVGSATPPWAKSAAGVALPTHYELDDSSVTQVIDTDGLSASDYPVVADPAITVSSFEYVATNVSTRTPQPNYNRLIGGCRVATQNSTCTVTGSYSEGTVVTGSLGITANQVAATLGISVSTTVTGSMGCTSPQMAAGSSYRAYIMGTYRYFTLQKWKVTKAGGQTVRRLEAQAQNQVAFTPINMIYCTR